MQFSTLAVAAAATLASAQMTHVVNVGMGGALTFSPNKVEAAVGDAVQFQFLAGAHSVVQSTFDGPCVPANMNNASIAGFNSGFMKADADPANAPTYTVMVKSAAPVWVYCAQGKHCQAGMVMVINENTNANSSRSLENYAAGAKQATTVVPGAVSGGTAGTTPTNSTSTNEPGTSTPSGSNTPSTTTSSSNSAQSTGASSSMAAPSTFGLFAAIMAMFML